MKLARLVPLVIIVILIISGASGCISNETNCAIAIQAFLTEKYECEFSVHKAVNAFCGNNGSYIYAVCECTSTPGSTFEVYCYPNNGSQQGETVTIAGKSYVIFDKYPEVFFSNQMAKELTTLLGDQAILVNCQIRFDSTSSLHYEMAKDAFADGLKSCLDSERWLSYVMVYVVTQNDDILEDLRVQTKEYCLNYNAYRQYIYVAVAAPHQIDVQQHYRDFSGEFSEHMKACDLVHKICFVGMKRDEGVVMVSVIKND